MFVIVGSMMIFSSYRSSMSPMHSTSSFREEYEKDVRDTDGTFALSSPMFYDGGDMPHQYTCTDEDGNTQAGISPPLQWSNPPAGTQQYLITLSATYGKTDTTRYDWVLYGISSDTLSVPEDGAETVGKIGGTYPGVPIEYKYRSPCCPISGVHSFTYKIYALSGDLSGIIEGGGANDFAPDILTAAGENRMVLAKATMTMNYCRCGCDGTTQDIISCLT